MFLGLLALGLLLVAVAGLGQAQEGASGGEAQQWDFAPASEGGDGPKNLVSPLIGPQPAEVAAEPSGLINYQGQLIRDGNPYNGNIDITFRLYAVPTGGSGWWQETQNVQVDDGLFNVMLGAVNPLDDQAVSFQSQQWLGVQPAGAAAELTPRQPLGVVAYAMNLMPGATMVDTNTGGPYGYSFWVYSDDHPSIYARSESSTGITGSSSAGTGVYGSTSAANMIGVLGSASGSGNESHGVEASMSGDSGVCSGGVTECGAGLYATASGDAYASFLYGENRSSIIAIQGDNTFYGLWVNSTIAPNGNGIWTNGASSFADYVTFSGGKSGYVVDIALNDGGEALEKGDVVVISGFDAPVMGNIPVVRVRGASEPSASGVMGVVDVLYVPCANPESLEAGQACGGFEQSVTTIQPGQYLSVVTLGAYEAIKVDAASGPIRPGDLLSTSSSTGSAMKAPLLQAQGVSFNAPGTIVGKALGSLNEGTGIIPVFVSSR
jgi:hypothetical protein